MAGRRRCFDYAHRGAVGVDYQRSAAGAGITLVVAPDRFGGCAAPWRSALCPVPLFRGRAGFAGRLAGALRSGICGCLLGVFSQGNLQRRGR